LGTKEVWENAQYKVLGKATGRNGAISVDQSQYKHKVPN